MKIAQIRKDCYINLDCSDMCYENLPTPSPASPSNPNPNPDQPTSSPNPIASLRQYPNKNMLGQFIPIQKAKD